MSETLDKALEKLDGKVDNRVFNASDFLYPTVEYLKGRAREDPSLAEDILNEKRSMNDCCSYIFHMARNQLPVHRGGWIKNETVYEWAEDYWRATDNAIGKVLGSPGTKKKAPKAKPSGGKKAKAGGEKKFDKDKAVKEALEAASQEEKKTSGKARKADAKGRKTEQKVPKTSQKTSKAKKGEMEGQLSLFDFIN